MKKIVLPALVSLFMAGAFAYDFSALITDSSSLSFNEEKYDKGQLKQIETFTGAFTATLGKKKQTFFAAEGSVQHKLEAKFGGDSSSENNIIADLSLLKLSTIAKIDNSRNVQVALGRYFYSDLSGSVHAQNSDGVSISYSSPSFVAMVYGGYSGLQNVKNVQVLTSKGKVWAPSDEKKVYDFTAPYAVGSLCLSAPYLFLNQTIAFEGLGIFNVNGPADLSDDDKRLYGTFSINGPLSSSLFYGLSGTAQTIDFSDFGILGKFSLTYFAPYKNSTLGFAASYASGESGKISSFRGFTKTTGCLSKEEPVFTEMLKIGVSGSIIPVSKLFLSLGADLVFKMPENSAEYYGFQVSAIAKYQFFSDLNMTLNVNQFMGKYSNASRTEIALGLAIAL